MADRQSAAIVISDSSPLVPYLSEAELNDLLDFDFDLDLLPLPNPDQGEPMPPVLRSESRPGSEPEGPSKCEETVLSCFPDICPDFLRKTAIEHEWDPQRLITHLLDEQEKGRSYPRRPTPLKRKRPEQEDKSEEETLQRKFEKAASFPVAKGRDYLRLYTQAAKTLLKSSFPQLYSHDVDNVLKENHWRLYPSYLALDKACSESDANPKFKLKKSATKRPQSEAQLRASAVEAEMDALLEFDAARASAQARAGREADKRRREQAEAENRERAKAEGTIMDCGCCYDEFPLNRMVHCDGEVLHWFCCGCARRMAEHAVGASQYHLGCMSMDGCGATFSKDQKDLFLDEKLCGALDLLEQEAVLRMAEISNLETCPFCPYAAIYPPKDDNKEFQCENPKCGLVSCRLCRKPTHIPKTCEEAELEQGQSARHKIEEAMSEAMIRKCNKCGTPFIKELGCNKMMCTRSGCHNVQCYVCSKSCDYTHFDDSSRGGKKGNCPLFDSVEQRHEAEVQAAEEKARKLVQEENPGVDAKMLNFDFSEGVKKDEERRKAVDPPPRPRPGEGIPIPLPPQGLFDDMANRHFQAAIRVLVGEQQARPAGPARAGEPALAGQWQQALAAHQQEEPARQQVREQAGAARQQARLAAREQARLQAEAFRQQAEAVRQQAWQQEEAVRQQARLQAEAFRQQAEAVRQQAWQQGEAVHQQARQQAEAVRQQARQQAEAVRQQARQQAEAVHQQARQQAEAARQQQARAQAAYQGQGAQPQQAPARHQRQASQSAQLGQPAVRSPQYPLQLGRGGIIPPVFPVMPLELPNLVPVGPGQAGAGGNENQRAGPAPTRRAVAPPNANNMPPMPPHNPPWAVPNRLPELVVREIDRMLRTANGQEARRGPANSAPNPDGHPHSGPFQPR